MRTIEIIRTGDVSVTDQMAEMRDWLHSAGIEALEIGPVRILKANVRFRASFPSSADAERFRTRFDAAETAPT